LRNESIKCNAYYSGALVAAEQVINVKRKICVVTTSRAEFGLLSGLIKCIEADQALGLQVIVTGMHLSSEFGMTVREIETEGVRISRRIKLRLEGNSAAANAKAIGRGTSSFADAFMVSRPDIVVLLGDRYELLAPAIAALMLQMPIAHLHGGELTEGAIDDSVRHAITKMASIHFAATERYRTRIIQMGEPPDRVFNFGAPGLDALHGFVPMSRKQLERDLDWSLRAPVALVTWHPVTRNIGDPKTQLQILLKALATSNINALFTAANADAGGARINAHIKSLCARNPGRFRLEAHLGHRRYLSCLTHFDLMVGNSSSGLTEAPSFRLPVVNIGDRQRGRIRAKNVIDVPCSSDAILNGIAQALSPRFRSSLRTMRNPYARFSDGRASERIKDVLKTVRLDAGFLMKTFHDLE
jgi:UDP-hydrolysing UDP-N-acetyl-D-glucosamine 2-epimerase